MARPKTVRFGNSLSLSQSRWNPNDWVRIREAEEINVPVWLENKKTGEIISIVERVFSKRWGQEYEIRFIDNDGRRITIPIVGVSPQELETKRIVRAVERAQRRI